MNDNISQKEERKTNEIEARNVFVLSHILGSEENIENISIPQVVGGNYNENNLNVNGLRFIVECQISEGGFDRLKETVEKRLGPHSFFFLDLAGETENFFKFFSLYQKHLRNEVMDNRLLVARDSLERYGIKEEDLLNFYPFVEII